MARVVLLLTSIVVACTLLAAPASAATSDCSAGGLISGCPNVSGSTNGGEVVLTGEDQLPGGGNPGESVGPRPPIGPGAQYDPGLRCLLHNPTRPQVCAPSEPSDTPPVTVRDIASFVPTPGQQRMEPDGWAIAGLDTNFYAITSPHIVPGTLLGRPADVRFAPIAYHWDYGDGTTVTKSTKGATWAAQRVAEFDPTPTSHVYEEVGTYTITLDITFAAEYRFDGSGWRPVVGTITLPANDLHIRAGTVKTVLVDEDCIQNPKGPGC